ncbi:nuclear transport factor 2 family protein [Deinococcus misasensis]|uniref:nuclear transport factor 2 family protein n=1 Tax=Deinococcus misasensis TaxID=392413 RepID=UPI00068CEB99|nr:nuclear transport factor 2 family protein [Deinococcus misasensis]
MYHAIVRSIVRSAFQTLSLGKNADLNKVMALFAPDAHFSFAGEHALGGDFKGPSSIRAWFERFQQVFPEVHFEVQRVVVSGWPWNTLVNTFFTVQAPLPDGTLYQNQGLQVLRIGWGKIKEDHIFEDVARLKEALERLKKSQVHTGS